MIWHPAPGSVVGFRCTGDVRTAVTAEAVYGCDALLIAAKMGLGSLVGRRGTHGCRWSISSAEVWVDFGMENANGSTNRHMSWNVQF